MTNKFVVVTEKISTERPDYLLIGGRTYSKGACFEITDDIAQDVEELLQHEYLEIQNKT